jgi:hypothetical protein
MPTVYFFYGDFIEMCFEICFILYLILTLFLEQRQKIHLVAALFWSGMCRPGSWGNSVSTVSAYRLGDRGFIPGIGKGFFLQPLCAVKLWGPPNLLSSGYRVVLFLRKARPGRDADHSPHLVPSPGMRRSYTFSPLAPAWP